MVLDAEACTRGRSSGACPWRPAREGGAVAHARGGQREGGAAALAHSGQLVTAEQDAAVWSPSVP